jgi:hypothetical protein
MAAIDDYANAEYYRGKIIYLKNLLLKWQDELNEFLNNYNTLDSATQTAIQNFLTADGTWDELQNEITVMQNVSIPTTPTTLSKTEPNVLL